MDHPTMEFTLSLQPWGDQGFANSEGFHFLMQRVGLAFLASQVASYSSIL